jgi:hypothetical protein
MSSVRRWDKTLLGELCLDAIRSFHQPPGRFRISLSHCPAGKCITGAARAGRRYVLSGACLFSVAGITWNLEAGEFADLPAGNYEFRATSNRPVEFVSVWELPPEFWVVDTEAEQNAAADRGNGD